MGRINMLKVVIADDEAHICRLIQALVDWKAMGLEVVGIASNGIEAMELVDTLSPDILITDIRMPGCNGLELIRYVKTSKSNLEVIIISGYAHFPYAQTAMKYGVSNYLLKPINKIELIQILQILTEQIEDRRETEKDLENLINNNQNARQRLKDNFLMDLVQNKIPNLSFDILREEYDLQVKEELFQTFCIKMDYDISVLSESALEIVKEKTRNIIVGNFQNVCIECIFSIDSYWGICVLNYETRKQDDIRRIIRQCLNQLVIQKSILGPIEFTISTHSMIKHPEELAESLQKCKEIMKERIVLGTERVIETVPKERGLKGKNLLEGYSRMIAHAVEIMNPTEATRALDFLKNAIKGMNNIRGYEVLELMISAGTLFLMQIESENQKKIIDDYTRKCEQCSNIEGLFAQLEMMQVQVLEQMQQDHDNEAMHPMRMAKKYIQNHYQEQITLEEVSEVVGLSSSYFSALFKKECGEGFAKYLINIRVDAAKVLLRESNASISAVCKEVGYNDLKHFTATFEKITGLKPSAYRKLYG